MVDQIVGWVLTVGGLALCFVAGLQNFWLLVPALALLLFGAIVRGDHKERTNG